MYYPTRVIRDKHGRDIMLILKNPATGDKKYQILSEKSEPIAGTFPTRRAALIARAELIASNKAALLESYKKGGSDA